MLLILTNQLLVFLQIQLLQVYPFISICQIACFFLFILYSSYLFYTFLFQMFFFFLMFFSCYKCIFLRPLCSLDWFVFLCPFLSNYLLINLLNFVSSSVYHIKMLLFNYSLYCSSVSFIFESESFHRIPKLPLFHIWQYNLSMLLLFSYLPFIDHFYNPL